MTIRLCAFPKQRGFTLIELMIVVIIIGIGVSLGISPLFQQLKQAQATRIFPYSRVTMEYLAGYHTIYGDWPSEVANPLEPIPDGVPSPLVSLAQGQWPLYFTDVSNRPVWAEGEVFIHEGSFLITSNVIERGKQDTVAFYLRPVLVEGIPAGFVWDCASAVNNLQDLPDPTTLEPRYRPSVCR